MDLRSVCWCVLLSVLLSSYAEARRLFFRGRQFGGMLGSPRRGTNVTINVPDEYFEQQLDHFNPTEARTFQQRYFTNASFHLPGGPVFLMIGGEAAANPAWVLEGQWINYAQKYHALCFMLEHRFYGLSRPTKNIDTKYLRTLSSEQALSDLANFIEAMTIKYELPPNTKWIAFGGSYPGSLAAWLRAKFPHLVEGAVSASAPLLAKADFKEYYRVVKDDLSLYNSSCVSSLREANHGLRTLLKTPMGQETVNIMFRLCDPIDVLISNDVSALYDTLAMNLAGIAQYNNENRQETNEAINLNVVCKVMVNESIGTPVHRYAAITNMILEQSGVMCLDYKYDSLISDLSEVDWESDYAEGARQWFYQTCTEFGFYQTSSLTIDIFGNEFPLDFFVQQCADVFGKMFNKEQLMRGIRRTNINYGAMNQRASRIVYVHGSLDPWHALGITKTLDLQSPAIYIRGTAHCADMFASLPSDPPQLQYARKIIDSLIGLWLVEK
ncbi:hypothetical protein L9F63_016607 [Diploptera punctata]|uniref:Serine protease K12H4.7 n=1 Tax=Diploptera punctata TaxID=6984 RepID=A0AAD8A1G5_DIPPU|nr:hypothetical protein L9F63_016607 [Diploptera punctata]